MRTTDSLWHHIGTEISKSNKIANISCLLIKLLVSQLLIAYYSDGPNQQATESSDVFIKIGETHTLTCAAKSEPSPVFTWLINGYETFENIATRDYTSNLQVHVDSAENLQTYTCLASNIHGQSKQTFVLKEKVELEDSPSKTSSKTAGVILYTLALIISTFIIY